VILDPEERGSAGALPSARRCQVNDDHGKKVKGYEQLLPRLERAKAHRVRVLWLVLPSVGFRIFVDLDTSTLLGVLIGQTET